MIGRKSLAAMAVAAWAVGVAPQARCQLLDQPPTRASSGTSDLDCGVCASGSLAFAEDLVLASAGTLSDLRVWGGYIDDEVYDDRFRVRIFLDSAGLPSPPALFEWTDVPVERTATGLTVPFSGVPVDEYRYDLTLPQSVALPAATYWLEVANDSTGQTGDWVWGYGTLDAVRGRAGAASSVSGAVWFQTPAHFSVRAQVVVLTDGFESGDTTAWTTTVP